MRSSSAAVAQPSRGRDHDGKIWKIYGQKLVKIREHTVINI